LHDSETLSQAYPEQRVTNLFALILPPLEMLSAADVLVFAGNDDIRDTWSPYGTGRLRPDERSLWPPRTRPPRSCRDHRWKGDFRRDDRIVARNGAVLPAPAPIA